MLTLSRKPKEAIAFYRQTPTGPEFFGRFVFVGWTGSQAKLGFEFPDDVLIVREEIDHLKERLNEAVKVRGAE